MKSMRNMKEKASLAERRRNKWMRQLRGKYPAGFLSIIIISISIMNKGERYVGNKKGKLFEEKKR